MRCAILRSKGGKNGVRGTKYKLNLVMCELIINKRENICVGDYWNEESLPGRMLLR
jgi:hypothetical protein